MADAGNSRSVQDFVRSVLNAVEKVHDVFFLWDTKREEIDQFILEANRHNPTIKFTAVLPEKETNFFSISIFQDSISDSHTHLKPTETFQYREPPLISYRRGKSLIDIIVRSKL